MTPEERLARINAELAADDQMPSLESFGISSAALAEATASPKKFRLRPMAIRGSITLLEKTFSIT